MLHQLISSVTLCLLLVAIPGAQMAPKEALDGLDPVLLVAGKEVSGKADFEVVRGSFTYLFSSAETKATFEREPQKYEIQLGGLCARMGRTTGANPADFIVHDGKIYVFGSDDCHRKFAEAPDKYLPPPAPPMPMDEAAAAKGRMLVERAVAAFGGSGRLDKVNTLLETASQVQSRPQGEVRVSLKTMSRFPNEVRIERRMSLMDQTRTSATLMTSEGAWFVAQNRAYPMLPAARVNLAVELGRRPLALLRGRGDAGFMAAGVGRAKVAGVDVEQVRVKNGSIDVTLGLDPETGRVRTTSYVDRNDEGEYGAYTIVYDDYREVEALTLPFAVNALFNGKPDSFQSLIVESVEINPILDPSLFTTGESGGR